MNAKINIFNWSLVKVEEEQAQELDGPNYKRRLRGQHANGQVRTPPPIIGMSPDGTEMMDEEGERYSLYLMHPEFAKHLEKQGLSPYDYNSFVLCEPMLAPFLGE